MGWPKSPFGLRTNPNERFGQPNNFPKATDWVQGKGGIQIQVSPTLEENARSTHQASRLSILEMSSAAGQFFSL